jgi:alpha-N-acetylglucosaminidase
MDLFHEGGRAGDVPVDEAARAVEAALQRAHPGATWAILGWQGNPERALLDAIDTRRMLILDGLSDRNGDLDREKDWAGTPYAFGTIWNFGGHTTMGANVTVWNERFWAWRARPHGALSGIALMPEASDDNPAAFEFFTELPWHTGPVDVDAWFEHYADRRYGGEDPHARAAWRILLHTAYSMPADGLSEAQEGLFGARPALDAASAATWSPKSMRYDPAAFERALGELLRVAPALRGSSAYRYDLTDVTRQVLSNRSRRLLPRIRAAYEARDRARFDELTGRWLGWMKLMDEALATNEHFLLGPWLADARGWGSSDAERAALEYDARSLITVWGSPEAAQSLHDYANREWAGLVGDYYYSRWKRYFDGLDASLATGRGAAGIDWVEFGDAWAHRRDDYPTEPAGEIHEVAQRVLEELSRVDQD